MRITNSAEAVVAASDTLVPGHPATEAEGFAWNLTGRARF